jgi:hypothetical protein
VGKLAKSHARCSCGLADQRGEIALIEREEVGRHRTRREVSDSCQPKTACGPAASKMAARSRHALTLLSNESGVENGPCIGT